MSNYKYTFAIFALLFVVLIAVFPQRPVFGQSVLPWQEGVKDEGLGADPLLFVPNSGIFDEHVQFQTNALGGSVFFTSQDVVFVLPSPKTASDKVFDPLSEDNIVEHKPRDFNIVRVFHKDSQRSVRITGTNPLTSTVNYLNSSDRNAWKYDLASFGVVSYEDLYQGVSLHYDGSRGSLKSYYIVQPGVDASVIEWGYKGVSLVSLDNDGNLLLTVKSKKDETAVLTDNAPIAWQIIDGIQKPVDVVYNVRRDNSIGFSLGSYNPAYALIIDPTITYSSYLGGSAGADVKSIDRDINGYLYVTGTTSSPDFPGATSVQSFVTGSKNTFVTKYTPDGRTVVYRTFLGTVIPNDIAVDGSGNAYITGHAATSNQFPVINAYQPQNNSAGSSYREAFLLKLNAAGNAILFSTYLGGFESEFSRTIAVHPNGSSVFIAGSTQSRAFPVLNAYDSTKNQPPGGISDGFIAKFSSSGGLLFSTFFSAGATYDVIRGIAVNNNGEAIVVGSSTCPSIVNSYPGSPTSGGGKYYARLSSSGTNLLNCALIGGGGAANGVAVDGVGSIYIAGITGASNFPIVNAAISIHPNTQSSRAAFLTKITSTGNSLVYSTYLGGGSDSVNDVAVSSSGIATVVGSTDAKSLFPQVREAQPFGNNASPTPTSSVTDAFISQVNPNGTIQYSTFIGGNAREVMMGVKVDSIGQVYAIGTVQDSYVSDGQPPVGFPFVAAQDTTYNGNDNLDSFLMVLHPLGFRIPEANIGKYDITQTSQGQTYIAETITRSQREFRVGPNAASLAVYNFGDSNVDEILVVGNGASGLRVKEINSLWGSGGVHNVGVKLSVTVPQGSTGTSNGQTAMPSWGMLHVEDLNYIGTLKPGNIFQRSGKLVMISRVEFWKLFDDVSATQDYSLINFGGNIEVLDGANMKSAYIKNTPLYMGQFSQYYDLLNFATNPTNDFVGNCQESQFTLTSPSNFPPGGLGAEGSVSYKACENWVVDYSPPYVQWKSLYNEYKYNTNRDVAMVYSLASPNGRSVYDDYAFEIEQFFEARHYEN